MSSPLGVQKFLNSKEAEDIREELRKMMEDPRFNTDSTYSPDSVGEFFFVDKHMKYLSQHLTLNPQHYLSNLRLMTRKK